MADSIEWIRPTKTKITTNAEIATIAHCKSLGWKRVVLAKKPEAKKEEEVKDEAKDETKKEENE